MFCFENDKLMIIFDYWKDPLTSADSLPLFIEYADKNKPIYVIVSHHHKDHYSKGYLNGANYLMISNI